MRKYDFTISLGGVGHNDGLCIAARTNDHVGAGSVHHIPCRCLYLSQNVGTGGKVGNADFAVRIGREQPILGERAGADHTIQAHFAASGSGDPELRSGQGLARQTVTFLDDDSPFRLIFEREGYRFALLDLNGLALGVNDKSVRSLGLLGETAASPQLTQ